MVRERVDVARRFAERPQEHDDARQPELVAQAAHRRRDHAEILGDRRAAPPSARLDRVEELAAGAALPAPVARGLVALGDRPVRDEAAEVVDAREVDELEDAAEALDPPAVARRAVHGPVVERVAPVLAVGVQRVGRRARDLAAPRRAPATPRRRRRCRRRRSARRRSGGRRARDRTRAARSTRARSAPGRRSRRCPQSAPTRRSSTGAARRSPRRRRPRHARLRVGEQAGRAGERGRRAIRRAELVGRPEREDLPPRLSRGLEPVDEAVRLVAEPPAGQRRRVQEDSG